MSEIIELVQGLERVRSGALNITVADHDAKHGLPQRMSVVIFDRQGVVVVTLHAIGKHWSIAEVKADSHFDRVKWPTEMQAAKTPEGAFAIIETVIDCVAKANKSVAT